MVALLFIAMILTCLIVDYAVQYWQERRTVAVVKTAPASNLAAESTAGATRAENDLFLPEGVFVNKGHLWNVLLPSGKFRIGADRFLLNAMGKIDRIVLPTAGQKISKNEPLMTIQQGDKSIQLKSPADGIIQEVNQALNKDTHQLENLPLDKSWAVTLQPAKLGSSLKEFFIGEEARHWMKQEVIRFREFLNQMTPQPQMMPTMQDGGLPKKGVLTNMDQETWAKFENLFLSVVDSQTQETDKK